MNNSSNSARTRTDNIIGRMRSDAEKIFRAGLGAADPFGAVHRICRIENDRFWIAAHSIDLKTVKRIWLIGAGKATARMAQAVEELLGDRITQGLISVKYGHTAPLHRVQTVEAGHPRPDDQGVAASRRILQMVSKATRGDLVLVLISGGGSALLPLPQSGISVEEKQKTTDVLLSCGATIQEINAIRKHLSAIKGGRLAQAAAPAQLISLILSDVVGDDLDVIASGPTVPDRSTFQDCSAIIRRYGIAARLPQPVKNFIDQGAMGKKAETPKADTCLWDHVYNHIIGSNSLALQAAAQSAAEMGYATLRLSSRIEGEARTVAQVHTAIAREALTCGYPLPPPACILSGGETTVAVKGGGKGGRNQEFALSAAIGIDGCSAIVILSAGTDGTDGPTDAAGAFVDHLTVQRSKSAGLDIRAHLDNNDAYPFFRKLNDLLITGPTGTNVMDLNIVLIKKQGDTQL